MDLAQIGYFFRDEVIRTKFGGTFDGNSQFSLYREFEYDGEVYRVHKDAFSVEIVNVTRGYYEAYHYMKKLGEVLTYIRYQNRDSRIDISHIRCLRDGDNYGFISSCASAIPDDVAAARTEIMVWPYPLNDITMQGVLANFTAKFPSIVENHYVEMERNVPRGEVIPYVFHESEFLGDKLCLDSQSR